MLKQVGGTSTPGGGSRGTSTPCAVRGNNPFRYLVDYCTGTCASLYAYVLGFQKLHLLGMDCQYVEFLPECIKLKDGTLKINETPKDNPNYYFNEYQQKGDIYNPPMFKEFIKNLGLI